MKGKIFTAQEVQALIAGNKTMFREVIKHPKDFKQRGIWDVKCPYQVGQKIFCKESWRAFTGETLGTPLGKMKIYSYPPKQGDLITYKADADLTKDFTTYLSSTTMPHCASRLTLLIKEIRVERLGEISEEDAIAEAGFDSSHAVNHINNFAKLWNATHKKPEEKFEASPWVWVMNFSIINN